MSSGMGGKSSKVTTQRGTTRRVPVAQGYANRANTEAFHHAGHVQRHGHDDSTAAAIASSPYQPQHVGPLPASVAIEAVALLLSTVEHGKDDALFTVALAEACGFGWSFEEADLRKLNSVLGLHTTIPSWLLSTFRDAARQEFAMANERLVAAHALFIGRVLNHQQYLQRLVLHGNHFGNDGAVAIAKALALNTRLDTLHLVNCEVGDEGAVALAHALETNIHLDFLSLEENYISDRGAIALGAVLNHKNHGDVEGFTGRNKRLMELKLNYNYITPAALPGLKAAFLIAPRTEAYLTVRSQMRPGDGGASIPKESVACRFTSAADYHAVMAKESKPWRQVCGSDTEDDE